MANVSFVCRLMVALCVFCIHINTSAGTLVGVVSDRSAGEAAAGVDQFKLANPNFQVVLRTPTQLAEMNDAAVSALFTQADAVLLGAVFGDQAPRLLNLLAQASLPAQTPVFAVSSDMRLVFASRDRIGAVFPEGARENYSEMIGRSGVNKDMTSAQRAAAYPRQAAWLRVRAYWMGRGSVNLAHMLEYLFFQAGLMDEPPQPVVGVDRQYRYQGKTHDAMANVPMGTKPLVVLLDLDVGARQGMLGVHDAMAQQIEARGFDVLSVFARWGEPSFRALEEIVGLDRVAGLVSFQDFVIGGGGFRESVVKVLEDLNLPVIHAIRLTDLSEEAWRSSVEGLPWRSIHYRLAMPEFQGISQPVVVACAGEPRDHANSGVRLTQLTEVPVQIQRVAARIDRWHALRSKENGKKRVAVIYYNHPPGRHNIGADNLDVVQSLWDMLHAMKAQGYDTGPLPDTPEALLERLQDLGVNLPENSEALSHQAQAGISVTPDQYRNWFQALPQTLQSEMVDGPLGYLHQRLRQAADQGRAEAGEQLMHTTFEDLDHILAALPGDVGRRARDLIAQLKLIYLDCLAGKQEFSAAEPFLTAIIDLGIEGLKGWGKAPGRVMVHENKMLIPGMQFGKVFVGPQPPRGWELDEELLHANLSFPPTHQYMGFYFWLQQQFRADVLVHLGRHSTYEFLPRRRAGLYTDDYSWHVAGELPGVYPYIVDGVGEGIQAKRRGLAVMVDHLTPPLRTTPLYDKLLMLRDLVESYESAGGADQALQQVAVRRIRQTVTDLNLVAELEAELRAELHDDSLVLDKVDDEMLVHEVGHYLTELQERFMPIGLHVFGRDWTQEAVDMMMTSMDAKAADQAALRLKLKASPAAEMTSFFNALDGGFVAPGEGNDPVRTPSALPTGRNFHALSGDVLPTRTAYELARNMAATAVAEGPGPGGHGVVLWASDTVRDQGVMVAFGMALMGIKPTWNSRGIVVGVEPVQAEFPRREVVYTTSGLFRDLYGNLLGLLDRAALTALATSGVVIEAQGPMYQQALAAALEPLGEKVILGREPLSQNLLARAWLRDVGDMTAAETAVGDAGRAAALRIFGDAPGAYGAGINRLTERSGSWQERSELAAAYTTRMGHAYGLRATGTASHQNFERKLGKLGFTYLGRSSNLYGLLDNNDGFDYLGGLSLAVEIAAGKPPQNRVMSYADAQKARVEPLTKALLGELRGRFLNPAWIEPLMDHGYSGARTMGSKFVENLWGWQVTNPDVVQGWVWDEVKRVYMDDGHGIGLDAFLNRPENAPVKANMLAVFLVSAEKGFWQPDQAALADLARQFVDLVAKHGLPGSGHTTPDHPVMDLIHELVDEDRRELLVDVLNRSRVDQEEAINQIARVSELVDAQESADSSGGAAGRTPWIWLLAGLVGLAIFGLGLRQGLSSKELRDV